jgi:hypothetical protein
MFINNKIAHKSWIISNDKVPPDMPIKLNWNNEAYIQECVTEPKYRGQGLYPFTLTRILSFLILQNKTKAFIISQKSNYASIKGIIKAGFKKRNEAVYIRLFYNTILWKEKTH